MHILPSGLPPSLVFRNGRLFGHDVPRNPAHISLWMKRYSVCKRQRPASTPNSLLFAKIRATQMQSLAPLARGRVMSRGGKRAHCGPTSFTGVIR
jgi:hypothetical protein